MNTFVTGKLLNREELWTFLRCYNPKIVRKWNESMESYIIDDDRSEYEKYDFLWKDVDVCMSIVKTCSIVIRTWKCCDEPYEHFVIGICTKIPSGFKAKTLATDLVPDKQDVISIKNILHELYSWKDDEIETFVMPKNTFFSRMSCPTCGKEHSFRYC
jgi:hypothetical protein